MDILLSLHQIFISKIKKHMNNLLIHVTILQKKFVNQIHMFQVIMIFLDLMILLKKDMISHLGMLDILFLVGSSGYLQKIKMFGILCSDYQKIQKLIQMIFNQEIEIQLFILVMNQLATDIKLLLIHIQDLVILICGILLNMDHHQVNGITFTLVIAEEPDMLII